MSWKVFDFICLNSNCKNSHASVEMLVDDKNIHQICECGRLLKKIVTATRYPPTVSAYDARRARIGRNRQ